MRRLGYYLCAEVLNDPPPGISHRDLLVLLFMAHSARDYPKKLQGYTIPASTYTAGWSWIAIIALRRERYDATAERQVGLVLASLRAHKAIEPIKNPLPGSPQRAYLLQYVAPERKPK